MIDSTDGLCIYMHHTMKGHDMARLAAGFTKRKDGRLQNRFTIDGTRYTVYGWTVAEAKEKERQKREEIEKGLATRGRNTILRDYVSRWIDGKEGTVKDSTLNCYRKSFPVMLDITIGKKRFGDMRLVDIDTQDVRMVQKALTETTTIRTANHYISLLSSVMRSAINNDRIITFNPVAPVKPLRDTATPARESIHRALTKNETNRFFNACGDSWYRPLFRFMLLTGCRIGEAGALQVRDIRRDEISIERTVTLTASGLTIGDSTKTGAGRRCIPLSDELREVITQQRKANATFGSVGSITDTVFKSVFGHILRATSVNEEIGRICKKAGITPFTAHAFRDTFATRCVESGMNFKTLQTILGHTDIKMTMNLYAHVMQDTKREELSAVNFD